MTSQQPPAETAPAGPDRGNEPFWWSADHGPLRLAFTSTAAGTMSLNTGVNGAKNRSRVEQHMKIPPGSLKFLNQVHSATVHNAAETPGAEISTTSTPTTDHHPGTDHLEARTVLTGDAWISPEAGQPLAIMTADCLPVLFAATREPSAQGQSEYLTAAAHAGRIGLLDGVLENTVAALREHGAQQISAWIGPAACGDCYEVPQQMVDELAAQRPALASTTSWGTPALNLRAEAGRVLEAEGVLVSDIFGCTIEDAALYSHRGSQQTGASEGRIAGLIWQR
ncbi:polyphenol oxidase family protein [Nesterenkonia massiliensis]|uniref:polyphenol oxidase family protein n=1 Tax=Nesterenkonia massiliensis TaxID=1232429 RepID=UPI0006775D95|nr:polyphenol oxidase family protein [Nesterenkonia massiliensis]